MTEFLVPTANSGPCGITAGPDGALWFTEELGNKIGRIQVLRADVNGDGEVTAVDALCVLRLVAGLSATSACPSPLVHPDVNGGGNVDAVDGLCVLRFVAGLPGTRACPEAPATAGSSAPAAAPHDPPASFDPVGPTLAHGVPFLPAAPPAIRLH